MRRPRSLELAGVGLALVGLQLLRGGSIIPELAAILSPPAAMDTLGIENNGTGTVTGLPVVTWDAGGFGAGIGRAGVPTCRAIHMAGPPDTVRITRNVTASLGTHGNAFCHELCAQTAGCKFTRTQMGGDNMFGIIAWKLSIGRLKEVDVVCDMLEGFDCVYPWFTSQARAPDVEQVAVATRPFRMPDNPRDGPNGEHDAVVMAHAQGYPWSKAEQFVVTLRGTGFKGGLHIALKEGQLTDRDWITHAGCYNVTLWVPPDIADLELHPQQKRWEELRDRLEKLKDEWELEIPRPAVEPLILVVDIRDTFFQANPFADVRWLGNHGATQVLLFPECLHHGMGRTAWDWMTKCWGEDRDQTLVPDRYLFTIPMICSGGFVGTFRGIHHVVKEMATEIRLQSTRWCTHPNASDNKSPGWDQGFLNRLYYRTQRLQPVKGYTQLMASGTGPIMHTSVFANWKLTGRDDPPPEGCAVFQDPAGNMVSYDAPHRPVAVVHQYDRLDPIAKLAAAKTKALLAGQNNCRP